jgi:hypothetical protein
MDLVPVLLRDGVRLLDHLGSEHIELESTRVIEGAGGHASYLPRCKVRYQPDQGFLDGRAVVICCWPPIRDAPLLGVLLHCVQMFRWGEWGTGGELD